MLIPLSDLGAVYDEIRNSNLDRCSIAIFVAGDVDALAACKCFTALLQADSIQFSVVPVANYTELEEELGRVHSPRALIFFNCGGSFDLTAVAQDSGSLCYVLDSQRPFWGENVRSRAVKLVDDNFVEQLESEEEEPEAQVGAKRSRGAQGPRQRLRAAPEPTGIYFGRSTAGLVYLMGLQMSRVNNEMLWLWVVGLTEQYLHKKINRAEYDNRMNNECLSEVYKLNPEPYAQRTEGEAEHREPGSIVIELRDLQLMLYRHWNLYESMQFSDYLVCKMGLWKAVGKKKLHELIAHLGIPLRECRQSYKFMNPLHKANLRDHLTRVGASFSMNDLFFTTCVRQYDRKTQFSAADVVYVVTALLESPVVCREDLDSVLKDKWLAHFWLAYESLFESQTIEKGVATAIEQQKAVIQQGTSLIEKKAVNPAADFRYAVVTSDTIDQIKHFHHPFALKKLTKFLMEATKELRGRAASKPMVVGVHNSVRNTYLVSGLVSDDHQRNDFGWRFHMAAESANAEFRRDFFEDSFIEVRKEHFQVFLEQLIAGSY